MLLLRFYPFYNNAWFLNLRVCSRKCYTSGLSALQYIDGDKMLQNTLVDWEHSPCIRMWVSLLRDLHKSKCSRLSQQWLLIFVVRNLAPDMYCTKRLWRTGIITTILYFGCEKRNRRLTFLDEACRLEKGPLCLWLCNTILPRDATFITWETLGDLNDRT